MKTLIYSAWTCAFMSGMILLATNAITYVPAARAEAHFLALGASFSFVFWAALAFFLQWQSKKWTEEPSRGLKLAAFIFAALYLFTFLFFFV